MLSRKSILFVKKVKKSGICFKAAVLIMPILATVAMLTSCVSAAERLGGNKRPFIDIFGTKEETDGTTVQGRNANEVGNNDKDPNSITTDSDKVDIGIDLRDYRERWTGKSYAVVIDSDHEGIVRDDIILSVNGQEVFGPGDVENILSDSKAGDRVSLVILRKEKEITVEIVLKEKQPTGVFYDG